MFTNKITSLPQYSLYYQATVDRKKTWFLVAVLRSCEGLAFDRTRDKKENAFEFLVCKGQESAFLRVMSYFIDASIVHNLEKHPNPYQQI